MLERCTIVEPDVFSNCEVVRNSPDAHFLDLVFANNGQSVYVASTTGDNEQEERFLNPFKYLASLFAFRKPGPNVYVTQHVNLCYGGNCNITIEDIMEFTLGNITYDYSKHRSLLPGIGNGSSQDRRTKGLFGTSATYMLQTSLGVNQWWISMMLLLSHGQFSFKKGK